MPAIPNRTEEESIQDSITSFRMNVLTNTPYTGPIGFYPGYGYLGYSTYQPANIVLGFSPHPMGNMQNESDLDELLKNAGLMATLFDFFANGSATMQANEVFYWNEVKGKFLKTPKVGSSSAQMTGYRNASDLSKIGKTFGKVASWVNVGITATQLGREGLNFQTGTNTVICAIGFIPGVGWVISGAYCIANIVVEEVTRKEISEHIEDVWIQKVAMPGGQKMGMLERWLQNVFFYDWMRWMY